MHDRDFLHIEDKSLREEYFSHLQKIIYVFELSSVIGHHLAQYKSHLDSNNVEKMNSSKSAILSILKMSGMDDITESQAADPSFSAKALSTLFNNVLFNYTNFIVKHAKNENIRSSSLDEDVLNLLVSEDSEGEDPNKVFDLLYNAKVPKTKLKA